LWSGQLCKWVSLEIICRVRRGSVAVNDTGFAQKVEQLEFRSLQQWAETIRDGGVESLYEYFAQLIPNKLLHYI